MNEQKVMNRWMVAVGAILIQLALGAIYAWSVFTPALTAGSGDLVNVYGPEILGVGQPQLDALKGQLKAPMAQLTGLKKALTAEADAAKKADLEAQKTAVSGQIDTLVSQVVAPDRIESLKYGFTKAQSQGIFSVGLAFFALVMVMAGRLMPKTGPRKLAILGGLTLGLGYVLAGLVGGHDFWLHLILIGVVGGSGIGLGYVVPIATGIKWFPDKKGLITGLAVAGFGFGAFMWIKLGDTFPKLIAMQGLPTTFIIYGIAFALIVLIGSLWMSNPPAGWKPAGWAPPQSSAAAPAAGTIDYKSGQMLKTPQFYMIWVVFLFGAAAGLMTIGLAKMFPTAALTGAGLDPVAAAAIASTAAGLCLPIANGLGRIVWGLISDKLGRKLTLIIMTLLQGGCMFAFTYMAGNEYLLYVGAALIGFNFGGNFALFPAITADTFGTKFIGQNYGWVFLAYGVGGIGGPLMGGILGDMGNFPMAFTICAGLCLFAGLLAIFIRAPKATPSAS